jgi:hypothetical protein
MWKMTVLELRRYEEADAPRVWCLHDAGLRQMDANWGDGPWDDDLRSVQATYLDDCGDFLRKGSMRPADIARSLASAMPPNGSASSSRSVSHRCSCRAVSHPER